MKGKILSTMVFKSTSYKTLLSTPPGDVLTHRRVIIMNLWLCQKAWPVPIVLVKCWKVSYWNSAKKLLKDCDKFKKLLTKFQKLLT